MFTSKVLKAILQLLKCISVAVAFSTYLMQQLLFLHYYLERILVNNNYKLINLIILNRADKWIFLLTRMHVVND